MISFFPLLYSVGAYIATTALAALAYALVPNGIKFMAALGVAAPPEVASQIGSPIYFALLLLPLVIVPAAAIATVRWSSSKLNLAANGASIDVRVLAALVAASFGYCAFRLHQLGALNFDLFQCGDRQLKMIQRMKLLDSLGYPYMFLSYGVNMMLPILAYLAAVNRAPRLAIACLFAISLLGMVFFVVATFSKAPILVFAIMMSSAVACLILNGTLKRVRALLHLVFFVAVCFGAFVMAGAAVNVSSSCGTDELAVTTNTSQGTSNAAIAHEDAAPTSPFARPATKSKILTDQTSAPIAIEVSRTDYLGTLLGFGMVQRIAVGFPFYVDLYSDEDARCGIQGSMLRSVIGAPPPKCIMAVDVFKKIWPTVTYVEGNQPAGAYLSAYGEIGFWWSITVMVMSGIALGALGYLCLTASGTLAPAICAAACGFGYYLTQIPFIGAFTYHHGLAAFLLPVILLWVTSRIQNRRSTQSRTAEYSASSATQR